MSSEPLLKTKLPYSDSKTSIEEAHNYMVKTLNSSFIEKNRKEEELAYNFNGAGGVYTAEITLNHGMGIKPSRFIVSDLTVTGVSLSTAVTAIIRTGWTEKSVTFRLVLQSLGAGSFTGSIKILVQE